MNWNEVMLLRAWMPLSELEGTTPVFSGVVLAGPDAYLRTQDYNRNLEMDDPNAPFVTLGYWAPSREALRRTVEGDPKVGSELPKSPPPSQLLNQTAGSYAELRASGKSSRARIVERAVYSNQGQFLYRLLDVDRLTYYFLGSVDNGDERPSVIEIRLL